jgi:hypothetical protein
MDTFRSSQNIGAVANIAGNCNIQWGAKAVAASTLPDIIANRQ